MKTRFPYGIDGRGRTAEASEAAWVRGLIEQVIFTTPGERVMRPEFGSGVMQLVFAPNSQELAATTQMLMRAALQEWLGDVISVENVTVEAEESTLRVSVSYLVLRTQTRDVQTFERTGVGP